MSNRFDLNALPEDCIANALSLTTPKDACRLSAVATTFCSAAHSDAVWERFLPSDYHQIVSRSVDGSDSLVRKFDSKKELFMHLCDHPVAIDGGLKSFWLDKCRGTKCFMLAARDLYICWSDTPEYWQWIYIPESRFGEVAELRAVCWFEIRGKINMKMLSPGTEYTAYLVFTKKSTFHGFHLHPVEASIRKSGNDQKTNTISFGQPDRAIRSGYWSFPLRRNQPTEAVYKPNKRADGWLEVEMGQFFVEGGEDGDLDFNVMEVEGGNWKGGLLIRGIEIRPKENC